MIGFIQGKLHSIGDNSIIILANGIGFEIEVHDRLFYSLPLLQQEISIYTYHHVREDQQTLFGFSNLDEKNVFLEIICNERI